MQDETNSNGLIVLKLERTRQNLTMVSKANKSIQDKQAKKHQMEMLKMVHMGEFMAHKL